MSVLYLVVPLAIIMAVVAVVAFVWAARGEQFEDLETPAIRMVHEEEELRPADRSPSDSEDD